MTTPEPSDSFEPIPYDPVNPKWRLTSSERSSHRLQPYTRTSSTSGVMQNNSPSIGSGSFVSDNCGGQKEAKKLALKDLPQGERPTVKWARKRLVMDLLTTVVWPQNETDECRDAYLNEVLNQANSMYGTSMCHTAIILYHQLLMQHTRCRIDKGTWHLADQPCFAVSQ